ncbi:MAG: type I restriction enzyme HsdR N-terminal domain-containing protein, partial [Chloroflexi bacterium]|nr:type I restriction enzyme HsdR N-terminal domain-containing protein [Chloroflexota bacterium]
MNKTFAQSQDEIARLVNEFRIHRPFYFATDYKEAQARQDLIDPLFMALDWDVRNDQRVAPQQREVLPEFALVIERHKKSADYLFRSGHDKNLFFVEAKKPGVPLKTDPASAYQVRRYGWTKKLPLSILTDFEEFAVYDCNARPYEKDAASVARLEYYTYQEYPDQWRKLWDMFSRDAVLQGALDKFSAAAKTKRGTQPVDAEFLKEIEGWRAALAKNIALLNPRLSLDDLNDAVQRTIDRIIFLRMAEDRGTEEYGRLQTLAKRDNIYAGLLDFYYQADTKYNSGLFDFKTDTLAAGLKIDDDKLRAILRDLYYPKSPYVFSALAADTLGNVYEQFLGKVIRLTPAHQAKIEEKPEVKKAGGVYYTP